jgi:hypothetical protein
MRVLTAPALLLPLILAACAADLSQPTTPDAASFVRGSDARGASVAHHLTGQCDMTFSIVPSAPPIVRQEDAGTCELSQLGASATTGTQAINFGTGTQSATRSFTAANGDALWATSAGTSSSGGPGLVNFDATLTIIGGTGRFTNATGAVHDWGTANLITHAVSLSLDGWISYAASDRRE